jgi:hypothetical protein
MTEDQRSKRLEQICRLRPLEGSGDTYFFLLVSYDPSLQYTNYVTEFGLFIELHSEEGK